MNQPPRSERSRAARRLLSVGLALLVVGNLSGYAVGTPGPSAAASPRPDAPRPDALDVEQELGIDAEQERVDLNVDCNESVVRVTAPARFEYVLRVSNLYVTASGTEVFTTATTESGNATVNLSEQGPVYAFLFSDAGLAASTFEDCTRDGATRGPGTTQTPGPSAATLDVDCGAGEVRVAAPADFAYTLRVSTIAVTTSSTEVFTTATTGTGNATVPVGAADGIAAFVSNGTETVASAFENCAAGESGQRTTTG